MAEGLFLHLAAEAGLRDRVEVESAGTSGHHAGEQADRRMRETAARHGLQLTTPSRPIAARDYKHFDYLLTMDRSVHREVLGGAQRAGAESKVILMRDFDPSPDSPDVPDPYYGGPAGFEEVYQILLRSNVAFLEHIRKTHHI